MMLSGEVGKHGAVGTYCACKVMSLMQIVRGGVLFLQPNAIRGSVTKLGHVDVFDAQSLGSMCGPFHGDFVVHIGPGWMVVFGFALVCHEGHELPGLGEGGESVLARDAFLGRG